MGVLAALALGLTVATAGLATGVIGGTVVVAGTAGTVGSATATAATVSAAAAGTTVATAGSAAAAAVGAAGGLTTVVATEAAIITGFFYIGSNFGSNGFLEMTFFDATRFFSQQILAARSRLYRSRFVQVNIHFTTQDVFG